MKEANERVSISALGVMKFRLMLQKKGNREDFQVFRVLQKAEIETFPLTQDKDI